jgi:hypothetical protein
VQVLTQRAAGATLEEFAAEGGEPLPASEP